MTVRKNGSSLFGYTAGLLNFPKLQPLVKWAGGKEKELKYIIPNLPKSFANYYEPFVGGGAVYTAIRANHYFINDRSTELISFYRSIINTDRKAFFMTLEDIIQSWLLLTDFAHDHGLFFSSIYRSYAKGTLEEVALEHAIDKFVQDNTGLFHNKLPPVFDLNIPNFIAAIKPNLLRKIKRMKQIEAKQSTLSNTHVTRNVETALKSAFYMYLRHLYNHPATYQLKEHVRAALFLFIRNFAYSGMFRYNANGNFNVPYGGMAYNRKRFQKKVNYLKTEALKSLLEKTIIENMDFEVFLKQHRPTEKDFVFLDPPYDTEFSTYAQNEFTKKDQKRLANYLTQDCKAQWMMILKNTDFIYELYKDKGLKINSFGKTYLVSFMNRNQKNAEHLLITNY